MLSILHYQERYYNEYVKLFSNLDEWKGNANEAKDTMSAEIQVRIVR